MGFSLKQMLTPPKSIRKFQPKKLGNISWWKSFGKEVAIPAALAATGLGVAGLGPLSGILGGVGSAIGSGLGAAGSALGSGLGAAGSAVGSGLGAAGSALGGAGGGAATGGNLLSQALNFAKGNPQLVLGGLDTILNARRGAEADKLRKKAIKQMGGQEKTRADLLQRALGLQATSPDLSALFADPSNPFSMSAQPAAMEMPATGITPRIKRPGILEQATGSRPPMMRMT